MHPSMDTSIHQYMPFPNSIPPRLTSLISKGIFPRPAAHIFAGWEPFIRRMLSGTAPPIHDLKGKPFRSGIRRVLKKSRCVVASPAPAPAPGGRHAERGQARNDTGRVFQHPVRGALLISAKNIPGRYRASFGSTTRNSAGASMVIPELDLKVRIE
jgi:hypothetical protein